MALERPRRLAQLKTSTSAPKKKKKEKKETNLALTFLVCADSLRNFFEKRAFANYEDRNK
jgi:hypothetical protein